MVTNDPPAGLVTFVFTDIVGSTRLLRNQPDEYSSALQRHLELLVEAWEPYQGYLVNTEGDGTLVAFADATAAVRACVQAQQTLAREPWPTSSPLQVRMGAHAGTARPYRGEYVALAVHQAARVAATAHGGQVVVSEHVRAATHGAVDLCSLGRFRVRDFDRPVRLYQAVGAGLATDFPAVRAVPAEGHNLSPAATTFVGREHHIEELTEGLQPGRLITVVGPGGVGKSRLAAEIGLKVAGAWPDGVWQVSIDDVTDSSLVPVTVADALGIPLSGASSVSDLAATIREARLLLVLDGCERHLGASAEVVRTLLRECPGVCVLATSREPLHVGGEKTHRLEPLAAGEDSPDAAVAPAVKLFVDRARDSNPAFELTETNLEAVAELCRLLDGLPLALEIAAGFASALSPADMVAGLGHEPSLLRSSGRDLPDRHQSMESLLVWSERLLSPAEAAVLRRLSVFAGTFSLPAAVTVGSGDGVTAGEALGHVWSLVDRSLVLADTTGGNSRYRMLHLVRHFAGARLAEAGETAAANQRARQWLLDFVGPERVSERGAHGRVSVELDNLRGLIAAASSEDDAATQEQCQLLGTSIAQLHNGDGSGRVGAQEIAVMADRLTAPTPARVALLTWLGKLNIVSGDFAGARRRLDEAERLRADVGEPPWDEMHLEHCRCDLAVMDHNPRRAVAIASEALPRAQSLLARVRLQMILAVGHTLTGELAEAVAAASACREGAVQLGDERLQAWAANNLAEVLCRSGQPHQAARYELQALELYEALGRPAGIADTLDTAARIIADAEGVVPGALASAVALIVRERFTMDAQGQTAYPQEVAGTDALLEQARDRLGAEAFDAALRRGQEISLAEAVEIAFDVIGRFQEADAAPPAPAG